MDQIADCRKECGIPGAGQCIICIEAQCRPSSNSELTMANRAAWMIYGANGYTGHLVAVEAKRRGLNPVLAGRRAGPIEKLATELSLPARVFDLMIRRQL